MVNKDFAIPITVKVVLFKREILYGIITMDNQFINPLKDTIVYHLKMGKSV